jgi:tRNA-specific 2-thiouridylase
VGKRDELSVREFALSEVNLFDELSDFECTLKVRYRTRAVPARVTVQGDRGYVHLDEPVFGLARGQFAVFYDGERLLGGGVIV